MFQANAPWYQDVSNAPLDPENDSVMSGVGAIGGFGGSKLRIDFSIEVLHADASTPMRTFTPNSEFYSPDCDHVPMPVPPGGKLEGESGYACTNGGDCHLIVVQGDKLYEMWRADFAGGTRQRRLQRRLPGGVGSQARLLERQERRDPRPRQPVHQR